jgi:hypothetical protein
MKYLKILILLILAASAAGAADSDYALVVKGVTAEVGLRVASQYCAASLEAKASGGIGLTGLARASYLGLLGTGVIGVYGSGNVDGGYFAGLAGTAEVIGADPKLYAGYFTEAGIGISGNGQIGGIFGGEKYGIWVNNKVGLDGGHFISEHYGIIAKGDNCGISAVSASGDGIYAVGTPAADIGGNADTDVALRIGQGRFKPMTEDRVISDGNYLQYHNIIDLKPLYGLLLTIKNDTNNIFIYRRAAGTMDMALLSSSGGATSVLTAADGYSNEFAFKLSPKTTAAFFVMN